MCYGAPRGVVGAGVAVSGAGLGVRQPPALLPWPSRELLVSAVLPSSGRRQQRRAGRAGCWVCVCGGGVGGGLSPPHCPSSSHSSHLPDTHTASTPTVRCPPLLTPSPQFSLCFSISPVRGRRRHPEFVTATQALTRLFSPPLPPLSLLCDPSVLCPGVPGGVSGRVGSLGEGGAEYGKRDSRIIQSASVF